MWTRIARGWFPHSGKDVVEPLLSGLAFYYLTTLVVLLGIAFGSQYVKPASGAYPAQVDFFDRMGGRAGPWYGGIADSGYKYNRQRFSNVALFPAYPVLARLFATVSGVRTQAALILVSHAALAAAFVAMFTYVRRRSPGEPELAEWAVVAMGLLPTTVFFRMAYSESLFVLVTIFFLMGVQRRWPAVIVVLIVGLATATRPVGLGLLPPFLLFVWQGSQTPRRFFLRAAWLTPLACWGITAYMAYQWVEFGEPLAFAKTTLDWSGRRPAPLGENLLALVTLEPIWSVYLPSAPAHWSRHDPGGSSLFSLQFANPIFFVLAAALVVLGAVKRWLTPCESLLAAMLLLIPYATLGYSISMAGMGRYAAAAVPVYLVLGRLLSRTPSAMAGVLLAVAGFLLGAYAALLGTQHHLI
ncbi:MAG: hypothetical protein WD847_08405 [Pirellulales bacterium]